MNAPRFTNRRSLRLVLAGFLALCTLPGCAQFVLLGYLLGGPPSIEPEFDAETKKSLSGKDNRIAVVCYAPTDLKWKYPKIDAEVASALSFRLSEHGINVVHPDYVRAWMDEHADWERADEIGEALHATHVIDIELTNFSLYEENTHTLYRGHAEVYVKVVEMGEDGAGEEIFATEVDSLFPILTPRSTEEISFLAFKREYLSRLSEELGWLFYERYNGDKIPWAN
ncbi:MAG: hypothetical protein AB7I48_11945 [Planctomycetaceae bacterium]